MEHFDLDPVDRVTAAAIGEPGNRTFYLQARKQDELVSLVLEKEQVAVLSAHIDQLLEDLEISEQEGPDPESLDLEQPIRPSFRVGKMGLGFDAERGLVVLECDEAVDEGEEASRLRLSASPAQMRSLSRRGQEEVAGGRPVCPTCGGAIDPEGHFCPPSNGHRPIERLQ
jgi:uncharacterized repeat protein (TIGR03847 family)